MTEQKCPKCKKLKKSAAPGSITQWLFTCNCIELESKLEDGREFPKRCSVCGKVLSQGRKGSFTQFIFRSSICSCKTLRGRHEDNSTDLAKSKVLDSLSTYNDAALALPGRSIPSYKFSPEDLDKIPEIDTSDVDFPVDRFKPIRKLGKGALV